MREKIKSLRGAAATSGTLERAADVLQDLGKELDRPKDVIPRGPIQIPAPGQEAKPIPVEARQPPPSALENIAALIAPLLHPLTTTGLVAIFVVFILLQREDLRNRVIKLAGSHDLQKTTAALDDAARRLSRLFLTQLALNSAFGLVIGTGLWLIGVPSAALWGILAAILRFVPYIGAVISAVFPMALAAAVDPGWTMLLWTAAFGADRRPRHRADAVRPQHRLVAGRRGALDVLDLPVGTDRSGARDASDDMSGSAGPPCRAAPISRSHVRRSPGIRNTGNHEGATDR